MERHFDTDLYGDRLAIFGSGSKLPLLHGVHGCLIKLGTKGTLNFNVAWQAVGSDNHLQFDNPLLKLSARLVWERWVGTINLAGWFHTFPHAVDGLRCGLSRAILTKRGQWKNKGSEREGEKPV